MTLVDELSDLIFLLKPDWNLSETRLYKQISNVLRLLANHPLRQDITVLIDSHTLEDLETASSILFHSLMQLSLEDINIGDIKISFTSNIETDEWRIVRSLLLAQLNNQSQSIEGVSQIEELPQLDLLKFAKPEVYQALQIKSWERWGNLFVTHGPEERAIIYYQKILEAQPTQERIYLILSNIYERLGRFDMAVQTLESGIFHCSDAPELYYWLVVRYNQNDNTARAKKIAKQASIQFPQDYTFELLYQLLLPQSYSKEEDIITSRQVFSQGLNNLQVNFGQPTQSEALTRIDGFSRVTNFFLAYQGYNDRDLQRQYGQLLHKTLSIAYPEWVKPRQLSPNIKKIRIGYLSSFLCSWSGTILFLNWLKYSDKTKFEIYAYQIGKNIDAVSQEFAKYSDFFHHLPVHREAIAEQILQDQLHILVYPELGMNASTLCLAGLRLAPIQCMAWGQPVTSGLPTIDYFLSSQAMEPEDLDSNQGQDHYTETLVKLPGVGISYPMIHVPPPQRERAIFGLRDDAIVYLSSQAPYKYLPQYDRLYAEIAAQVPTAQLVFLRQGIPTMRLEKAFGEVGLDYQDYCIFLPVLPRPVYFDLLCCCDIYLDTPGWAGGNTTLDAIAAALPIVTWPGELMRSRHSLGFLKVMGIMETIAIDFTTYVAISVNLARHPKWRTDLTKKMHEKKAILFDQPGTTHALEEFFQKALLDLSSKHP
jgi:predicted O-linked N-acetylglucosamine transferase (SPINDLY family)